MKIIREAEYRKTMEETVFPYLKSVEKEGALNSFDGAQIHWYSYRSPRPVRTVVILHGYTESARKYAEMIWYFLNSGSNVYLYDQRGHGRSFRPVEDLTLTHVDSFDDYVKDLECFLREIVPDDLPLRLYAHSMGGAVAALYLEKHPDRFPKAVLSSPMIAPARDGYPLFAGKLICRFFFLLGKSKERIFLSGEYPGEEKFEDSCATSQERFALYEAYRRVTPTCQNYSPTYRWTLESLNVTSKILKKGAPERVAAEVLLCSAEQDRMVINSEQEKLASRLPHCRRRVYHAKHEIFNSTDDVMEDYVNHVLDFLN